MSKQNIDKGNSSGIRQPKPVSNPNIRKLNDNYATKISKGEIEVTASREREGLSPSQQYDMHVKQKKLTSAQKQKLQLQKKLDYLNKSIQTIKNYDYAKGQNSSFSPKSQQSPQDVMSIIKKNRQFHERVKEDKRKVSQRKQTQRLRHQSKLKQQSQQKARKLEQQKAKKKQEIFENMQKIKNRMDHRQQQLKKHEEDYHKVIAGTTLFKKLEKEQALHQSNVLEERKKKLANIRNLHKPISIVEIQEHERKFFQALQEKDSMRERERRLNMGVEEYRVSYKSPLHKMYSQELVHEETNDSKIKADKMRQFAQHVRENFAPQVDQNKRTQIQKQIEDEENKKMKFLKMPQESHERAQQIRNKGLRYLQELRDVPKKRHNSSKVSPQTQRPHYTNYLTHTQHNGKPKWGSILDSKITRKEKAMRLQVEAEKMEGTLRMKQQKARVFKKDPDEVDDEYYEMVKAKLQLLQC